MQSPSHDFCPTGHAQPCAVHVWPDPQAAKSPHMHSPPEHRSASPVHSESPVQAVHPVALHKSPPHEGFPLQVQAPATQSFAPSTQSLFVQQALVEMHFPLQAFWPAAQPADESPRAVVTSGRPASKPPPLSKGLAVEPVAPHATTIRTAIKPSERQSFFMIPLQSLRCMVTSSLHPGRGGC
jgi:hypothetical protein